MIKNLIILFLLIIIAFLCRSILLGEFCHCSDVMCPKEQNNSKIRRYYG